MKKFAKQNDSLIPLIGGKVRKTNDILDRFYNGIYYYDTHGQQLPLPTDYVFKSQYLCGSNIATSMSPNPNGLYEHMALSTWVDESTNKYYSDYDENFSEVTNDIVVPFDSSKIASQYIGEIYIRTFIRANGTTYCTPDNTTYYKFSSEHKSLWGILDSLDEVTDPDELASIEANKVVICTAKYFWNTKAPDWNSTYVDPVTYEVKNQNNFVLLPSYANFCQGIYYKNWLDYVYGLRDIYAGVFQYLPSDWEQHDLIYVQNRKILERVVNNAREQILYNSSGGSSYNVGDVMPFHTLIDSSDWLLCDGSTFDSTVYEALYAYLDNSNVLPNLQGYGLVGSTWYMKNGSETHYDKENSEIGIDSTSSDWKQYDIKTAYADAINTHEHTIIDNGHDHPNSVAPTHYHTYAVVMTNNASSNGLTSMRSESRTRGINSANISEYPSTETTNITVNASGGSSTRPNSYGIYWYMRAK